MPLAVLSESSADEAAVRILVEALLATPTRPVDIALRTRGWSGVLKELPSVIKQLSYHTDAAALVCVLDSDYTPVHHSAHDQRQGGDADCRLCQLRATVARTQTQLRPRVMQPPLRIALGLAVPAIEAWYLCGVAPHVTEMAWQQGLPTRTRPYSPASLKHQVYGTERPAIDKETQHASVAARRAGRNLPLLEKLFPNGFGALARDVRSWTRPGATPSL